MNLKEKIIQEALQRKIERRMAHNKAAPDSSLAQQGVRPNNLLRQSTDFREFSQYQDIQLHKLAAEKLQLNNPFFKVHDGMSSDTSMIDGRKLINFSSYDYLGINGDARQIERAVSALEHYGVSSSASRMVSGERKIQQQLESKLAALHGVEDAAVFVSGHATNVSTIGHLFDQADLVIHDALIHNSVLEGIRLSGAARKSFAHNDWQALDDTLSQQRHKFRRVLVVVEGLYSMNGDLPDLPKIIEIKNRHNALLMVDEAHSMGVMGKTGKGIAEYFDIDATQVDIWMGTLSKALASTGGYIAGSQSLIDIIKATAPGFVYSVGLPPVLAAAADAAIDILLEEPWRVEKLRRNAELFDRLARAENIDTCANRQLAVIPVMTGSSITAARYAQFLFERGINVQPIIYPAVEERLARLRFFICATHSEDQIRESVDVLRLARETIG